VYAYGRLPVPVVMVSALETVSDGVMVLVCVWFVALSVAVTLMVEEYVAFGVSESRPDELSARLTTLAGLMVHVMVPVPPVEVNR
jgi:hypothetical protein